MNNKKEDNAFFRCHFYFAGNKENSNDSGRESFYINIFMKCGMYR